ncbi:hypothetical protein F53441_14033 [Fusarium austroafricanum]|uniref:Methyltransferase domain-containing protein n=1 Tax=Fusarium austroafricanum TaxID=2364996 RepID=A0A8H4JHR3_9HYPO|nr:hypothetical protein F53441_14033 [Fusarium austroafricanum]
MAYEVLSRVQPRDVTFRNYSSQQASDYNEGRIGYSESLIDLIMRHHKSTNGQTGTVLDIGCGPGTATRLFAPHFDVAYGADPGASMIETATSLVGESRSGAPILYKLSTAENIDKIDGIAHSSVDMITAATCAHWFEMPKFWAAAAKKIRRDTFVRHELPATENVITGAEKTKGEEPSEEKLERQLQKLERLVVTRGAVTRWQKENPELVGTKDDCVQVLMQKVRKAAESGESIDLSVLAAERTVALLLVKRN